MAVHLASTNDTGLRAAVKAPARHPDGTWNIKLTVAVFRPWRGSQATIASDPAFDAAPRFARPHRRLGEEFGPAVAGCWCREPLTPRLARPKIQPRTHFAVAPVLSPNDGLKQEQIAPVVSKYHPALFACLPAAFPLGFSWSRGSIPP
jgi:hypothetical protein